MKRAFTKNCAKRLSTALSPSVRLMGGERQNKTRKRERGQLCYWCDAALDTPPWGMHPQHRFCARCEPTTHRIYMGFNLRYCWHVHFLEADAKTPLRRQLNFSDPQKIRDLVERTPTKLQSEQKQALEYALELGRGGLWLEVTAAQYAVLCQ